MVETFDKVCIKAFVICLLCCFNDVQIYNFLREYANIFSNYFINLHFFFLDCIPYQFFKFSNGQHCICQVQIVQSSYQCPNLCSSSARNLPNIITHKDISITVNDCNWQCIRVQNRYSAKLFCFSIFVMTAVCYRKITCCNFLLL